MKRPSTTLILACACAAAAAQDDALRAVPLAPGEQIVLDGSLAHPAWRRAPAWRRFVETQPDNGAKPPQDTEVQVLYSAQALYVGITVHDRDPSRIRDVPVRRDQVNRTQDFVVVYVDPIGSRQSAQFFRVNAAGSLADGLHTAADNSEDFAPDFDWDAAVQRSADGWTTVLRLPFASLRFAQHADRPWTMMVARRIPREQFHLVASVPIPRGVPSFIATMQPLEGLEPPAQRQFLSLRPGLTLRRTEARRSTGATTETAAEPSLDLKWRPRAELVVDATIKPDFSQLELDVPQLAGNTRFALSLPEKRPFFFESYDLLRSPSEAFYTRSFTQPRWGLRGTWRGQALAGTLLAVDDSGGGLVLLPGPFGTGVAEQPASTALAGRVRHDFGAWQAAGLLAARRYAGGRGENLVAGPDLAWQIDPQWRLRAQWLGSHTTAQAAPGGGLERGRARDGQRGLLLLVRSRHDGDTEFEIDHIDAGFRHDGGFVNQAGVRRLVAFHSVGWRPVGPFNELFVNLRVEQQRDLAGGRLVRQDLRPGIYANAPRNLEWWLEWHPSTAVRTARDAPLLNEHTVYSRLVMTPASWFPLVDASLTLGRIADAEAGRVRPGARGAVSARLRPLRPLELELHRSQEVLEHDGRRAYAESVSQLLAVWHLDARRTLRLIAQRGTLDRRAEPGIAAVSRQSRSLSLTGTWRHSAGTVLYVGASGASGDARPRVREAFVKLQLDTDDLRRWW